MILSTIKLGLLVKTITTMKNSPHHTTDPENNIPPKKAIFLTIDVTENNERKSVSYKNNQEIVDDLMSNLSTIAAFSYNIREYALSEIIDILHHSITLIESMPKKLYQNVASQLESKIYNDEAEYNGKRYYYNDEEYEYDEDDKIMNVYHLLDEYRIDLNDRKICIDYLKHCIKERKIGYISDKNKGIP